MHKKIALLIKKICDESPYDFFKCKVIPNIDSEGKIISNGFWECIIEFEEINNAHSKALIDLLLPIGTVFGEGLSIFCFKEKITKLKATKVYNIS